MIWADAIPLMTVIGANLGTVIFLYNNLDKKIEENRKETNEILRGIQTEMKEFHTKLATQDLEFKMRLCAIEERNKGK